MARGFADDLKHFDDRKDFFFVIAKIIEGNTVNKPRR
jgi:hypothetical protein